MHFKNLSRRDIIKAAGAGALALAAGNCVSTPDRIRKKPNIILIMADDLGYECLGCYGSKQYQTPVLDELARTGIRFNHCYSQPVCTPSRVQIMTGRYNNRNYKDFGYLDTNEITFGNILKDAGYATCIAGKWQLNGLEKYPDWENADRPVHFGFEKYCLWQLTKKRAEGERYAAPLIEQNGKILTGLEDRYGPDVFCDYILDFIEDNPDSPFFVYYPMVLTHCPCWPTPDCPEWADPEKRKPGHGYWGEKQYFEKMVNYMDKIVGRIIKKLDTLGIRENTVVIFTGDNGTDRFVESRLGDRVIKGGKSLTTDAGTHVPLIINRPRTTPAGAVYDDLVDFSDFLPTFADISGAALPHDRVIDGRSFLPRIRGEKGMPRDWIFCHYWERGRDKSKTKEFVRDRRWKLYDDGRIFDLPADPLEMSPLNETNENVRAAKNRLEAAFREVKSR